MNVFAIGSGKQIVELSKRNDAFQAADDISEVISDVKSGDLVIHFWDEESMDDLGDLLQMEGVIVLLNSVNTTLREIRIFNPDMQASLFGFSGLPGFINRDNWEISSLSNQETGMILNALEYFNVKGIIVDDRVGLVTPRIVSMIINEAYYTVMEGTAEKKDIDIAMQLGTNYPGGPFQWVKTTGIDHIYELLDALYEDTKEERYKICPLLKQEYIDDMNA